LAQKQRTQEPSQASGIGKATALALAQRGIQVIGVVRDADRAQAVVAEIRDRTSMAQVDLLVADLSKLDEVPRLGEEVRSR
jgi:short-subunit dehydrogenase